MLLRSLVAFGMVLSTGLSLPARAESGPSPQAQITAGVTQILGGFQISRCEADRARYEPLVWGGPHATGGDKLGLMRTLPAPGWAGCFGQGRAAIWSGHEGYFGSAPDARPDDLRFRQQLLSWLLGSGKRLAFSSGHAEWLPLAKFSPALKSALESQGVALSELPAPITARDLQSCDALLIGNPWGSFTESEILALQEWVEGGGALLTLSLGWSWGKPLEDYPPQQLGRVFGWQIFGGTLDDMDAPNQDGGKPSFSIRPLSEYQPARVVVLKSGRDNLDSVKRLAAERPQEIYILEGRHMGLQLLNKDWVNLNSPRAAINMLDRIYQAQLSMLKGKNAPYGGAVIWLIPQYAPGARWYMHSGNPIVMQEGASADLVASFNKYGHPGWGVVHELGHNMHLSACGYLFGNDVIEPTCNIFSVRCFELLGWEQSENGHPGYEKEGYAHHAQADPQYQQIKDSAWVFLGLLDLIWKRYGWEGMTEFLAQAAEDTARGVKAPDDAWRTAYLVEGLSEAYRVDFAPLFEHWGYTLTEETKTKTGRYPQADIAW